MKSVAVCVLALCICVTAAASAQKESPVFAVADGFKITYKDVAGFKQIIETTQFHSSHKHYQDAAIRTWLFAEEAKKLGLGQEPESQSRSVDMVRQRMELSVLYIKKFIAEYPLKEIVIESYYRAHPQYQQPLDDAMRERIRANILAGKRMEILTAEAERLKKKYNLRIVDPSKGVAK